MLKRNKWPLLGILCFWLTSCSPTPPDVPVCEQLSQAYVTDQTSGHVMLTPSPACMKAINEPECGHCVYIVSGMEMFVGNQVGHYFNNKPWSTLKSQSVIVPSAESYAPLETYIINSCKKLNCDDAVAQFRLKLNFLNSLKPKS